MMREIHSLIPQLSYLEVKNIQGLDYEGMYEKLKHLALMAYRDHEEKTNGFYNDVMKQYEENPQEEEPFSSDNIMRNIEKDVLLRIVDNKWIDHLHNIDMLRDGIGLRAYGQKDPLIEYKKEAYDLFNNMMYEIQSETVKYLFRARFGVHIVEKKDESVIQTKLSQAAQNFQPASDEDPGITPAIKEKKVGRNEICPCGSGKKYKNCCGQ
jgi:preprotein translocase subunit SecA